MSKRTTALIFLALAVNLASGQTEKPQPAFGISFSGFIKTDIIYDSRQTTSIFKTMEFAGFTINEPLIDVTLEKGEGAFSRSEIVGNLGNTLFRNFVLYLDYKNQRMIIEKGVDFGRRYPTDKSGLSLMLSPNQEYIVFFVSPGTPAEQAGFRKNDVVLKINGKDPKSYGGLPDVRDLMKKEAGTVYQISIRRADKVRDLQLKLKELH